MPEQLEANTRSGKKYSRVSIEREVTLRGVDGRSDGGGNRGNRSDAGAICGSNRFGFAVILAAKNKGKKEVPKCQARDRL